MNGERKLEDCEERKLEDCEESELNNSTCFVYEAYEEDPEKLLQSSTPNLGYDSDTTV